MSLRKEYQQKVEEKTKEWGAKLEEFKAKAEGVQAETKMQLYEEIKTLNAKQEAAQEKLHQLQKAGEDAWEDLRTGVDNALDDLSHALNAAKSKIR